MEVSSTITECRVPRTEHREERYRGSSTITECRVPSTECSPSIENHHRVSSTVTEYRSMEYRQSPRIEYRHRVASTKYRVTNIETRINMSSSRITEYGVPSNEQQTISANIASIVRSSVQSDSNLETRKNV